MRQILYVSNAIQSYKKDAIWLHRILHYTKNFDAFKDSDFDKTTFGCRLSGQFVTARYNAYNREFKIRANLNKDGATCHQFCIRRLQKKGPFV